MGANQLTKVFTVDIKVIMNNIIVNHYPQLFSLCASLAKVFDGQILLPNIKEAQAQIDGIFNALERLYNKERIVVFPFLEKHFNENNLAKCTPAIQKSIDDSMAMGKMIASYNTWMNSTDTALSGTDCKPGLDALEQAWWQLCVQKEKMYEHFRVGE